MMNTTKILATNNVHDNRLHTDHQSSSFYGFSNNVRNWRSVSNFYPQKTEIDLNRIKNYLQSYFTNHTSIIRQYFQINTYIDKLTFEKILRRCLF